MLKKAYQLCFSPRTRISLLYPHNLFQVNYRNYSALSKSTLLGLKKPSNDYKMTDSCRTNSCGQCVPQTRLSKAKMKRLENQSESVLSLGITVQSKRSFIQFCYGYSNARVECRGDIFKFYGTTYHWNGKMFHSKEITIQIPRFKVCAWGPELDLHSAWRYLAWMSQGLLKAKLLPIQLLSDGLRARLVGSSISFGPISFVNSISLVYSSRDTLQKGACYTYVWC